MGKAILLLLCVLVGLTTSTKVSFENYKLYHIVPYTEEQLRVLQDIYMYSSEDIGLDVWNIPVQIYSKVSIMVSPTKENKFKRALKLNNIFTLYQSSNNVQLLLDKTMKQSELPYFDFTSYHTIDHIYENLDDLVMKYPDKVQIIVGGTTYEGREIKGVKISFKQNNTGVFLEGGINAREWLVPAVVMYITHQLLTSNDTIIRNMAESYDWYIFPSFNPDGYMYTHTTNRLWKKTLKPVPNCCGETCIGTDPNRNWDYKWNTGGTSVYCTDGYRGTEPFSEIETKSISEYIESIKDKFSAYFSFHSSSNYDVIFPVDTKDSSFDINMMSIAYSGIADTLKRTFEGLEKLGFDVTDMKNIQPNNLTSGSSVNYIKGVYNKPLVLGYGVQVKKQWIPGILQLPDQIIPTGENTIYSLAEMLKEAKRLFIL